MGGPQVDQEHQRDPLQLSGRRLGHQSVSQAGKTRREDPCRDAEGRKVLSKRTTNAFEKNRLS